MWRHNDCSVAEGKRNGRSGKEVELKNIITSNFLFFLPEFWGIGPDKEAEKQGIWHRSKRLYFLYFSFVCAQKIESLKLFLEITKNLCPFEHECYLFELSSEFQDAQNNGPLQVTQSGQEQVYILIVLSQFPSFDIKKKSVANSTEAQVRTQLRNQSLGAEIGGFWSKSDIK